ncbi:MAG TPA: zf-HC2 domain-containing protein [Bacteroidales bacterium]|nr:zf-HC2 domain-containing protein [Bacteroidales bacterium]HPS61968.1 zf-HC2 domain-containing protein [Bacteroidales bacterium]
MMDCSTARSYLFSHAEGGLPSETGAALEEHLAGCRGCARVRDRYLEMEETIRRRKTEVPPPFAATRLMQRIEGEFGHVQGIPYRGWLPVLRPAGLALALAFGIFIGIYQARYAGNADHGLARSSRNLESLRNDMFISQLADEENLMVLTR